jgi:hypothetical protein
MEIRECMRGLNFITAGEELFNKLINLHEFVKVVRIRIKGNEDDWINYPGVSEILTLEEVRTTRKVGKSDLF